MIYFKRSLRRRNATQFTAKARPSQYFITNGAGDVAKGAPSVSIKFPTTLSDVIRNRLIAQVQQLKPLVGRQLPSVGYQSKARSIAPNKLMSR